MRSNWSKNISTMKGVAQRLAKILLRSDVKNSVVSFFLEYVTKNAVIRSYEKMTTGKCQNRFSCSSHTRVDYLDMNRPWRKRSIAGQNREGSSVNILGRNFVRDIDETRCGIDRSNHSLNCANEIVLIAKVAEECDLTRQRNRETFDTVSLFLGFRRHVLLQ